MRPVSGQVDGAFVLKRKTWFRFPVGSNQTLNNWHSQLPCLTFSIKRDSVKPPSWVVDRWQLDWKTDQTSLRCLLAEATW